MPKNETYIDLILNRKDALHFVSSDSSQISVYSELIIMLNLFNFLFFFKAHGSIAPSLYSVAMTVICQCLTPQSLMCVDDTTLPTLATLKTDGHYLNGFLWRPEQKSIQSEVRTRNGGGAHRFLRKKVYR